MEPSEPERIAIVTGGNRGIGFETVKGLCKDFKGRVILTARNRVEGKKAVDQLNEMGCYPEYHDLDVTDGKSRNELFDYVGYTYNRLDVLVNNAGAKLEGLDRPAAKEVSYATEVNQTLAVNLYGALAMVNLFYKMFAPHARIVNVGDGLLSDLPSAQLQHDVASQIVHFEHLFNFLDGYTRSVGKGKYLVQGYGPSSYLISKLALVSYTFVQQRMIHYDRPHDDVIINCINPGKIKTRLTRFDGKMMPDEAAAGIVRLATLPENVTSPVGAYVWSDLSPIDWTSPKLEETTTKRSPPSRSRGKNPRRATKRRQRWQSKS